MKTWLVFSLGVIVKKLAVCGTLWMGPEALG
jgi:hypothetical protein